MLVKTYPKYFSILFHCRIENSSRLLQQLLDCVNRACFCASFHMRRLCANLIQVWVHMLALDLLILSQLACLVLFAQNARIVVDIVLEYGLSFLQIERHESVRILQCHLRIECLHWSVLNQSCHAIWIVLHCLCIYRTGCRYTREGTVPGLVLHILVSHIKAMQFVIDASDSLFGHGSRHLSRIQIPHWVLLFRAQ